jgi:hypothetical protein
MPTGSRFEITGFLTLECGPFSVLLNAFISGDAIDTPTLSAHIDCIAIVQADEKSPQVDADWLLSTIRKHVPRTPRLRLLARLLCWFVPWSWVLPGGSLIAHTPHLLVSKLLLSGSRRVG